MLLWASFDDVDGKPAIGAGPVLEVCSGLATIRKKGAILQGRSTITVADRGKLRRLGAVSLLP